MFCDLYISKSDNRTYSLLLLTCVDVDHARCLCLLLLPDERLGKQDAPHLAGTKPSLRRLVADLHCAHTQRK